MLAYDIGMHNGDDTEYYLAKGFRVIGVEAMPEIAGTTAGRFSGNIADGSLIIENVGIDSSAGER